PRSASSGGWPALTRPKALPRKHLTRPSRKSRIGHRNRLTRAPSLRHSLRMQSGPEQFRDWIGRRFVGSSRAQRDAAAHFGWDETFLSRLLAGRQVPGLLNAIRIE